MRGETANEWDATSEEGGDERDCLDDDEHAEEVCPAEEREEELVVVEPDAAADPRAWESKQQPWHTVS